MNFHTFLAALVVAVGVTMRFPFNAIQVLVGLLWLTLLLSRGETK